MGKGASPLDRVCLGESVDWMKGEHGRPRTKSLELSASAGLIAKAIGRRKDYGGRSSQETKFCGEMCPQYFFALWGGGVRLRLL